MKPHAYVIGNPVEQSRSPELFQNFFKLSNIDAEYEKVLLQNEELAGFCDRVRANDECKGFNITIPHKTNIMEYLDEIDPMAKEIDAVNAVVNQNGKLIGYNTDYLAIKSVFSEIKGSAVVLGAGGAAKATVKALVDLEVDVKILNRTVEKAQQLALQFGVSSGGLEEINEVLDADLIINTTSNPFESLDLSLCKESTVVADLTYYMSDKNITASAKTHGLKTVNGLEIFVRQAIPCAKMWFGVDIEYSQNLLSF